MITPQLSTTASMPDGNLASTENTVDKTPEIENEAASISTTATAGKTYILNL